MDKIPQEDTSRISTNEMPQMIEDFQRLAENQRNTYARHWYDNTFFDDGYHFRFISRSTGRIVDLGEKESLYASKRAIPKASRQIRGMANLVLSQDFIPQVRPEKVNVYSYDGNAQDPEYKKAYDEAKSVAKKSGHWLEEEWKNQDLDIKLALMTVLTLKHGISFMEVWPDPVEEAIKTQVYDAFDIYLVGNLTSIYDSPFIGKVMPKTIKELKANENFDKDQLDKINPDNRYASDEIKEAYLASKFGKAGRTSDANATLLLKEFFIKEYVNDDNWSKISKQKNGKDILKDREKGDPVIRQTFTAGKVWLRDEYVDLPDYPFIDFRWEPGAVYQPAMIERFMQANKSLDSVMSRLERFIHTMNVGVWMKRRGENFSLNNVAGGLVAEYEGSKPEQMTLANFPASTFQFIDLLNSFIEEQGVTTSALGKVPSGVKAWGAIESLKASEFANLHIAIKQLKNTIRTISEKMFDIADNHFVTPQTVMRLEKGEPDYFDIIGQRGLDVRKDIKEDGKLQGVVPIKKEYKVDIQIQSGLGYTEEGKKGRMMELANFMLGLAQVQPPLLPPQAIKLTIERLMETFKFGPTADLTEALEGMEDMPTFNNEQMEMIKVAVLETLKDAKGAGLFDEDPEKKVEATKVGVMEVVKDIGGTQQQQQPKGPVSEIQRTDTEEKTPDGKKTKTEVKTIIKEE